LFNQEVRICLENRIEFKQTLRPKQQKGLFVQAKVKLIKLISKAFVSREMNKEIMFLN